MIKIPCFGVLGDLILSFQTLNQKASHQPSGQHVLNDEYYKRIEAIQFTIIIMMKTEKKLKIIVLLETVELATPSLFITKI